MMVFQITAKFKVIFTSILSSWAFGGNDHKMSLFTRYFAKSEAKSVENHQLYEKEKKGEF